MKTAFNKIWRDLWRNKGRTLLVVMSIAVGVLAVGMIITSNTLINRQLALSHSRFNQSHVQIFLSGAIDQATVEQLSRLPEVEAIEGRLESSIRWKTDPNSEWKDGTIRAIDDFENQQFDLIDLVEGNWPERDFVSVPFNHMQPFVLPPIGGTLYFEINERERAYTVDGVVRDPVELSPPFTFNAAFYITPEAFNRIVGYQLYTQLRFTLPEYSEANAERAVNVIERNLRRAGVGIGFWQAFDPSEHFLQSTVDGVNLILTVMAIASLCLSTFLIINTMNALMVQQIPQVGIMKIVGGISRQIASIYLVGVAVYGVLSLLIAIPISAIAGDMLSRWLLSILNVTTTTFELLPQAFLLQIGVGLLTPLFAALWPVFRGVAIPVARAVSSYGIGQGQYGTRIMDRILGGIRGLPRLAALTLRNTFRRPGRVVMTEITLIVAGAIFMMVLTTSHSFNHTIDKIFSGFGYDVLVIFEQPQRIDEIIPLVESRPNVSQTEMWIFNSGYTHTLEETADDDKEIVLRGVPVNTRLFEPEIVAGRNLLPEDGHALLLNQKLAGDMGIGVGDQIIIDLDPYGNSTWTVVGLILDLGAGPDQNSAYMYRETLSAEMNTVGRASVVEVRGTTQSLATQLAIEKDLTDFFQSRGIGVAFTQTAQEVRDTANAQFNIITIVLLIMTVLIALVGSFGLSGTLSINVMERTREIGVMRAVGASSWDVSRVFVGEGIMLGVLSWVQAIPLSILGARKFVDVLGVLLDFPFAYLFSTQSVWLWFGIVIVLSLIASWVPARRATQISVRESLAYE